MDAKQLRMIIVGIMVIVIIGLVVLSNSDGQAKQELAKTVKMGDKVILDYTIFDANGNALETTMNGSNLTPVQPVGMIIDTDSKSKIGAILSSEAIGMKIGEEKEFNVSKELNVFGEYNKSLLGLQPRKLNILHYQNVSRQELLGTGLNDIIENRTFTTRMGQKITIAKINEDGNITIEYVMNIDWTIMTLQGIAKVTNLTEEFYEVQLEKKIGDQIVAEDELGNAIAFRITDMDEEYFVIDANNPMAGKDLRVRIRVAGIV